MQLDEATRQTKKLIDLADQVRSALIDFGHTRNAELIDHDKLWELYIESCEILGEELQ